MNGQYPIAILFRHGRNPRFAAVLVLLLVCGFSRPVHGQEFGAAVGSVPSTVGSVPSSIADPPQQASVIQMIFEGNPAGVAIVALILLLSMVSTYFIIVLATTITRKRLMPDHVLQELEKLLAEGEVNSAVDLCHQRENASLATEVVAAGLQRFQTSEFGFAEYRAAVEEAGEDQVSRLYRKTEVLNVIGSIAPMLGLTGTVVGMIDAFTTIASRDGMAGPEELAGGIGQALVTTLLGLVVAIPTMVALSFFRTRIDSLVAEAGKRIEQIMVPLGRKQR